MEDEVANFAAVSPFCGEAGVACAVFLAGVAGGAPAFELLLCVVEDFFWGSGVCGGSEGAVWEALHP